MRDKTSFAGYFALAAALALVTAPGVLADTSRQHVGEWTGVPQDQLVKKIRHELVMLPYYGVFDDLEFRVEGVDTVVLSGQVTRPTLRSEAENALKRVEGVAKIVNNVEVLPLSPFDDRIRIATFRAVYSRPGLDRYGMGAVPSIHIIVKNGNVTLKGAVASRMDMTLAEVAARSVPGVFSVTNNLRRDA